MKRFKKYIYAVLLIIILYNCIDIYAEEVTIGKLNIPSTDSLILNNDTLKNDKYNGNYIIGTYMFSYSQNILYDGILKVKDIMLASKSIDSNNLDDMIIYYIDGNNIINAFTGDLIENIDLKVYMSNYVDIESISEYSDDIEYLNSSVLTEINSSYYPSDFKDLNNNSDFNSFNKTVYVDSSIMASGDFNVIQVFSSYYRDSKFNELYSIYKENENIDIENDLNNTIKLISNLEDKEYFKVRTCQYNFDSSYLKCSKWSNVLYHYFDYNYYSFNADEHYYNNISTTENNDYIILYNSMNLYGIKKVFFKLYKRTNGGNVELMNNSNIDIQYGIGTSISSIKTKLYPEKNSYTDYYLYYCVINSLNDEICKKKNTETIIDRNTELTTNDYYIDVETFNNSYDKGIRVYPYDLNGNSVIDDDNYLGFLFELSYSSGAMYSPKLSKRSYSYSFPSRQYTLKVKAYFKTENGVAVVIKDNIDVQF